MLEKNGATFYASCDFCSECTNTDEPEFLSAVDAIKKQGWQVYKRSGEWFHKCITCVESTSDDFEDVG